MSYPKFSTYDILENIKKDKNLKGWFNDYKICNEVINLSNNYDSQCYLESFNTHNAQPTYEFMSILRKYLNKNKNKFNIVSYETHKQPYRIYILFLF